VAALQAADAEYKALSGHLSRLVEQVNHNAQADLAELDAALLWQQVAIAMLGVLAGDSAFAFAWGMKRRILKDLKVRSLAQRSANAAREIKSLISQSTERVEVGTRLVTEAGEPMQVIVSGVERVTQIICEITDPASQEAEGIGQVNQAVSRLDQMTPQNAALVEESAASAENLRQQAQSLSQVVHQFRLAQG
jgi:Methyl-accepting chemotaxis protein (MCP) signalling domain